jgi:SAM-dependent methyltransferase
MLNIKPTDRVLEVGSGNRPRKRANVLCDKFVTDNTERSGGDNIVIDARPFVVADGHALPFKDKSFDYVIASHILEHADEPEKFVGELARVAKRGYIETPSELGEKIFGWSFHRWIVHYEDGTIILRPRISNSPFGDYFHRQYANDLRFAEFVDNHFEDFYIQVEWENKINIRRESGTGPDILFNKGMKPVLTHHRAKYYMLSLIEPLINLTLKLARTFRKFE